MSRTLARALLPGLVVAVASVTLLVLSPTQADAAPTLSVSQRDGLDPDGQTVTVSGSGFDTTKGIYVAYCVTPASGQLPSPCGGGIDTSGTGGASVWISDDPPEYGEGLAQPFGPGGGFTVSLRLTPTIGDVDCRDTSCAVVTRADHLRTSDRSQDVVVPVTFATPPPPKPEEPAQPSAPTESDDTSSSNGSGTAASRSSTTSAPPDTDDSSDTSPKSTEPTFPEIDRIDPIEVPERMRPEPPRRDQTDGGQGEAADHDRPHDDPSDDEATDSRDDAATLAASEGPGAGAAAVIVVSVVVAAVGLSIGGWVWRRRADQPRRAAAAPDHLDGATT